MVKRRDPTGRAFFIGRGVTKPARVAADAFIRSQTRTSAASQSESNGGTGMSTGKSSKHSKNDWELFTSFKQRGEWVELQFMAQAALRRFNVSRPWGDNLAYDIGVEHAENFLRVQVKSTAMRAGAGYRCQCLPNKKHKYSLSEIDMFAAYVIPEDAWYLIPAVLLLGKRRRATTPLCPVVPPAKKVSYRYECYREAWRLLTRSRSELAQYAR